MTSPLPADDLPPDSTLFDRQLQLRLQERLGNHFYRACGQITQTLLNSCQWQLTTPMGTLTLTITCRDIGSYWYIVSHLESIAKPLSQFSEEARIQVIPPAGHGMPLEIGIDEFSAY